MQNTPSLEAANDRNVLQWAHKGIDLFGELLLEIVKAATFEEAQELALKGVFAAAEASNKLADYRDGAEATITVGG